MLANRNGALSSGDFCHFGVVTWGHHFAVVSTSEPKGAHADGFVRSIVQAEFRNGYEIHPVGHRVIDKISKVRLDFSVRALRTPLVSG